MLQAARVGPAKDLLRHLRDKAATEPALKVLERELKFFHKRKRRTRYAKSYRIERRRQPSSVQGRQALEPGGVLAFRAMSRRMAAGARTANQTLNGISA